MHRGSSGTTMSRSIRLTTLEKLPTLPQSALLTAPLCKADRYRFSMKVSIMVDRALSSGGTETETQSVREPLVAVVTRLRVFLSTKSGNRSVDIRQDVEFVTRAELQVRVIATSSSPFVLSPRLVTFTAMQVMTTSGTTNPRNESKTSDVAMMIW